MRRWFRYILNAFTVLSLLLCLATVVLWVRANNVSDTVGYYSGRACYQITAWRMGIQYAWFAVERTRGWGYDRVRYNNQGNGFDYEQAFDRTGYVVGLPYWFICLITALAPAACLAARLRRKRHPPGLCPKCHYDLRATPERCPECGHVPADGTKNTILNTKRTKQTKKGEEDIATDEHR